MSKGGITGFAHSSKFLIAAFTSWRKPLTSRLWRGFVSVGAAGGEAHTQFGLELRPSQVGVDGVGETRAILLDEVAELEEEVLSVRQRSCLARLEPRLQLGVDLAGCQLEGEDDNY